MIKYEIAESVFKEYLENYDLKDGNIKLSEIFWKYFSSKIIF